MDNKELNVFFKYNNYQDYQKLKDSNIEIQIEYINNRIQDELSMLLADQYIIDALNNKKITNSIDKSIGAMIQKELKRLN